MRGRKRNQLIDTWLLKNLVNRKVMFAIIVLSTMNCLYNRKISENAILSDTVGTVVESSLETYMFNLFGGYASTMFDILTLTSYLIIMITPIFFICKFLSNLEGYQSIPYVIRFGEKKDFLSNFIKTSMLFISLYFVIYLVISVASIFIFNFDVTTFETLTSEVVVGSILLRFLEVVFVFYFVLILYSFTKNSTITFIATFVAYSLSTTSLDIFQLNPFGISSLLRWAEYDNGFIKAFLFLIFVIGVMQVVLKKFLSNKFV